MKFAFPYDTASPTLLNNEKAFQTLVSVVLYIEIPVSGTEIAKEPCISSNPFRSTDVVKVVVVDAFCRTVTSPVRIRQAANALASAEEVMVVVVTVQSVEVLSLIHQSKSHRRTHTG